MEQKKKLSLATQIFIALVMAIIVGLLMGNHADAANSYINPFGTIFLNLIKFIVVPIVLFSIMCGIISMRDVRKVGSIGLKTVVYYLCTTAVAIVIGLIGGNLFKGLFPVIAENGPAIIGSLAMVLLTAYICYFVHALVVYSFTVRAMGGLSPVKFFKGMMPAILFAFSSASSVGTLPLNMECTQKLGASKEVSSFVLPLGATINMDGTAIYQGVCAIFIAACYGIQLTLPQMLTIVLTATLASIGTAGVPGAGMVMLAMVLTSVGLPVDGIALVAGVDRIFDMGRTTVNITGDACCSLIVSNLEKKKSA